MNLFVADPHWRWWIIWYFFLGGISAGAYCTSTLIEMVGREDDRPLARTGYRIAFPLIVVCSVLLILDLDQPSRFWHMLVNSEVAREALQVGWPWSGEGWKQMAGAPLLKIWSPMSVGSWALMLFGLCSFLSFAGSWRPGSRVGRVLNSRLVGGTIRIVGCAVGFFVAAYTGALLTATNQPLWSDSVWIAPLFLTSAASTGIAAMLLLSRRRPAVSAAARERLETADLWALSLEFVVLVVFLGSLGPWLMPILQTPSGRILVVGTLGFGVFVPLAVHLRLGLSSSRAAVIAAVLVLSGGFLMRYAVLTTPSELVARGGRNGADSVDHAGGITPRSKVFDQ